MDNEVAADGDMQDWRTVEQWRALKRLRAEGREDAFLKRKIEVYKSKRIRRKDAFYEALLDFPPLE